MARGNEGICGNIVVRASGLPPHQEQARRPRHNREDTKLSRHGVADVVLDYFEDSRKMSQATLDSA